MKPQFAPRTPEARMHRLGEEIGEVMIEAGGVLQIVGKAGRFGMDATHPLSSTTNRNDLLRRFGLLRIEVDDLLDALTAVETDLLDGMVERDRGGASDAA